MALDNYFIFEPNPKINMMKRIGLVFFLLFISMSNAQSAWPSESWSTATPLTSVMNSTGLLELSGLHWNPESNRLYVVHGDGRLRVLQLNTITNTFAQIGNRIISGGPEGVTQANYSADQFYTIDENNYLIKQYSNTPGFSSVTLTASWNLLIPPSPMEDTGNTGPEGIVFIPDANLINAGFTSSVTGQPYTSVKGAGGLFFIAHQDGGYIWVFDINPNVSNDFAYVGKYKTNRNESCDLAFDRSTGLLYILHNTGSNYIEVTDLSLAPVSETQFNTVSEYFIANPPDDNVNIEGFAIMPKCDFAITGSAFLCRDVENDEATAIGQDAIRWFNPYTADGTCEALATESFTGNAISVCPNPGQNQITLSGKLSTDFSIRWIDATGKVVRMIEHTGKTVYDVSGFQSGMYIIEIADGTNMLRTKWIKN